MNDQQLEQEIQARGLSAPRITPEHIEDLVSRSSVGFFHPDGTTLTVCVLQLPNGYTVTGENACVSPENWQQDIAVDRALEDAKSKVWALEAYLLAQRRYEAEQGVQAAQEDA